MGCFKYLLLIIPPPRFPVLFLFLKKASLGSGWVPTRGDIMANSLDRNDSTCHFIVVLIQHQTFDSLVNLQNTNAERHCDWDLGEEDEEQKQGFLNSMVQYLAPSPRHIMNIGQESGPSWGTRRGQGGFLAASLPPPSRRSVLLGFPATRVPVPPVVGTYCSLIQG